MKRKLTPEERALWRRSVRDVAPLRPSVDPEAVATAPHKPRRVTPIPLIAAGPHGPIKPALTDIVAAQRPHDVFEAGDPRQDRHAARGRTPIDATIDLHGHTQATARATLHRFVTEARGRGYRCILVITGKGVASDSAVGRGVLRASLPRWLNDEAFRQHIARASPAHQRHGGGGAFYLFLKPRRASGPRLRG